MPSHTYTALGTSTGARSLAENVSEGATGKITDTAVLDEDVVATGLADSMNAQPNPPHYTNFVLVEGLQYALKGVGKPTRYRFIEQFKPNFMIISESDIDQGLFLLTRRKHYAGTLGDPDNTLVEVQAYTGIEEESLTVSLATDRGRRRGGTDATFGFGYGGGRAAAGRTGPRGKPPDLPDFVTLITYPPAESSIFFERYGYVDDNALQLQISITTQASIADPNLQNSTMEPELISYDELSSLGSITQENITISETTTSDGTLISTPDEEIIDIGGGRRRSRRVITATAATSTSTSGGSTGGSGAGTGGGTGGTGGTGGKGAPAAKTEDVTVTTSGGSYS